MEEDQIVKLFALKNGWLSGWLRNQKEAMVSLYDREFTDEEVAMHCVRLSSFEMNTKEYLRPDFLMAFFSPFPKIEILTYPEISAIIAESPMVSPKVYEQSRYEDAWKFHIQKMVLLGEKRYDFEAERLKYLYQFVPKQVITRFEEFKKEQRDRTLEKMRKENKPPNPTVEK